MYGGCVLLPHGLLIEVTGCNATFVLKRSYTAIINKKHVANQSVKYFDLLTTLIRERAQSSG